MSTSSSAPLPPASSEGSTAQGPKASVDRPSAELLRILANSLQQASGVLSTGVEDLREQLGPIWQEIAGALSARELMKSIQSIEALIKQVDQNSEDRYTKQRLMIKRVLEEAGSKNSSSKDDQTFLFAQFGELENNLKRAIELSFQRRGDNGPKSSLARSSTPARGRESSAAASEPVAEASPDHAELIKVRDELEAARNKAVESDKAARKCENEKINYINDLNQAREELRKATEVLTTWRAAALGDELVNDASSRAHCDELVHDLLNGQSLAVSLLGHWMTFRAASPDRLPLLMRQIGEAYYAWRPREQSGPSEEDGLELALVRAMNARCERASVRNRVELIRQNTRFDPVRHEPDGGSGGTTVVAVRGWLVLKADNSVFYRAKVSVR